MSQTDTRQRIIDAAEQLFAEKGFNNTTMRAITGLAEVNLAAVNYHFGSKESLLQEVFERHILPLNKERRQRLEAVREEARTHNRKLQPRAILSAFIVPTLKLRDAGPSARNFLSLVGRSLSDPDDTPGHIFFTNMQPMIKLIFDMLCEALPDCQPSQVYWRLRFALSAMGQVLIENNFSGNLLPHVDSDQKTSQIQELLLDFVTRGMEEIN
ncbi:MAG: TetR family transcriptional regulator [Desulfovibrionaceae bacterium]|jgi:AcrR family transcriptional regulator|nr:TetR family transcriptional regulator [Desulfovibrionaceae bacterium]